MPITPDFLSSEIDYLTTHKELQESIMRDIVRRLIKTDMTVTDSAKWQAEKLQQSGKMYKDVISEISRLTKQSENEIKSIFADAETEVFNYADEILIKSGYIPDEVKNISPSMTKLINASLKKTSTEAKNLTKTTAITAQSLFIQSADLAHMQVASGAFPYQQAIKNAIQFASKQGTKVIYPSGHVSSLSVAMRRAVLTGVNQTCGQLQNMRADELGIDIMEITAHAGARPGHAVWQGQLVSRSGQDGYLSLSDIGYGEVTGFMGANCRHNWNMFFEGSARNYTAAQLDELKNEIVTYDGEEIMLYEALEKQRAMERSIRSIKSELVAYDEIIKNTSDADEKLKWQTEFNNASVKLKNKEAKLRDFCNQTNLKRDTYREQVFSAKTENGIKNWGKSTSQKAVWSNRKATVFNYKPGKGDYRTNVDLNYISSEAYANKFIGISGNKNVDSIIADKCRIILSNRNGTKYEELFAIDARSGRTLTYIKGKQEKSIQMTPKLKKILTSTKENSIIIIHNHPNNTSLSYVDIDTMSKFKSIHSTVAAGHNGSVYNLSGLPSDCENILLDFKKACKYSTFDKAWEDVSNYYNFIYWSK